MGTSTRRSTGNGNHSTKSKSNTLTVTVTVQNIIWYIATLFCGGFSFSCYVIAVFTTGWLHNEDSSIRVGLFHVCHGETPACKVFYDPTGSQKYVRALWIVGTLLSGVAMIVIFFSCLCSVLAKKNARCPTIMAAVCFFLSGVVCICAAIIWIATWSGDLENATWFPDIHKTTINSVLHTTQSTKTDDFRIAYSFYVFLFGAIVALPAGVLVLFVARQKSNHF